MKKYPTFIQRKNLNNFVWEDRYMLDAKLTHDDIAAINQGMQPDWRCIGKR